MKYVKSFFILCLCFPSLVFAEYQLRSIGGLISNNEFLIDSSSNGWVLVRDGDHKKGCPTRFNLKTKQVDRLCEHGLRSGIAINSKGHVLGTDKTNRLVILEKRNFKHILKSPPSSYGNVTLTDLNDKDVAIGFASKIEDSVDSYSNVHTSFQWNRSGKFKLLTPPKGFESASTFAWNINNRGEMIVQIAPNGPYRVYLRQRNGRYSPIGDGIYSSNFGLNERGQVSINSYDDYLFTPGSGLRKVVSNPSNSCSRCDYDTFTSISEDGRAIFHDGYSLTLSDYPHPAIPLTCLMPQNRKIVGSDRTVSDIDLGTLQLAKFLDDGRILISANLKGDGREQQLLIMEKSSAAEDGIYNYCVDISIYSDSQQVFNCNEVAPGESLISCHGTVFIDSFGSELPPLAINMLARQAKDSPDIICPENLVNQYQIPNAAAKFNFDENLDPGFRYYFMIDDPRFTLNIYNALYTPYSEIQTPILPCRAPFEGL